MQRFAYKAQAYYDVRVKARSKSQQDKKVLLAFLVLYGLALLAVFLARNSLIEEKLFRLAYNMPAFMSPIWLFLTQFGSFFAALAVIVVAWVLKYRRLSVYLAASTLIAYSAGLVTKELVARPRPLLIFDGVTVRDAASFGFGFPSVHTAFATVLAFSLWPWIPKKFRWVLIAWVSLVAFSRVYLGVHAPLDIIGGFAIGGASVFAARVIIRDVLKQDV